MTGITWIIRITRVPGMSMVTRRARMTTDDLDGAMFGMTGLTRKTRMTLVTGMTRVTAMTGITWITRITRVSGRRYGDYKD